MRDTRNLDLRPLQAYQERLSTLQAALTQHLAEALMGEIAAGWGQGEAPNIRTGALAQSIHAEGGKVGTPLAYGRWLEFGAYPWLWPALERLRRRMAALCREGWDDAHRA